MNDQHETLMSMEKHLEALVLEVRALRLAVPEATAAAPDPVPPISAAKPEAAAAAPDPVPPISVAKQGVPGIRLPSEPAPKRTRPAVDIAAILRSPMALAAAGGVIVLLGLVFLYSFASTHGYVTDEMRALGGGVLGALLLLGGARMRSRGAEIAGLVTAGLGIAGMHGAIAAASAMYGLIPDALATLLAIGLAGLAVERGLRWRCELIGLAGLGGAVAVPVLAAEQVTTGVLFCSLAPLAAACALFALRRWDVTAGIAAVAVAGMAMVLFQDVDIDAAFAGWAAIAIGAAAAIAILAAGAARGLVDHARGTLLAGKPSGSGDLASLTTRNAVRLAAAAGATLLAFTLLLGAAPERPTAASWLALAAALALGALAEAARRDPRLAAAWPPLAIIAAGISIAGLAGLLDGPVLVAAYSVQAVLAVVLARRTGEPAIARAGIAYATLASGLALIGESPLDVLGRGADITPQGALAYLAAALAVGVVTLGHRPGPRGGGVRANAPRIAVALCGILALTGLSLLARLGVEAVGSGSAEDVYERAETTISALWAVLGLGLVMVGLRRRVRALGLGGGALFVAAVVKLFLFDLERLDSVTRAVAFLAVGLLLLLAAGAYQRYARDDADEARVAAA